MTAAIRPEDHFFNPALIASLRQKQAFVPAGDPSGGMAAGGGGAPPGGAPPGGDPAAGGGAPPPGGGGGGGGGLDPSTLQPMIQQMVQQAMMQGGGGGAGGGGQMGPAGAPLKPKIDVNVEMMQIKNMLAKICDHLKIPIPAQDMVATSDKLMAMSQGQSTASPAGTGGGAGGDPSGGAGGAIGGVDPMQGMAPAGMPGAAPGGAPGGEKMGSYKANGVAFDTAGLRRMGDGASAILRIRQQQVSR